MNELLPIIRRVRRPLIEPAVKLVAFEAKAKSEKAESGSKVAAIEVPGATVSGATVAAPLAKATTAGTAVPPMVPTKKSRANSGSN